MIQIQTVPQTEEGRVLKERQANADRTHEFLSLSRSVAELTAQLAGHEANAVDAQARHRALQAEVHELASKVDDLETQLQHLYAQLQAMTAESATGWNGLQLRLDGTLMALHISAMAPRERTNAFQVRVTDEELSMIHELADARGLSGADIVRQLVREEFKREFGSDGPALIGKKKTKR